MHRIKMKGNKVLVFGVLFPLTVVLLIIFFSSSDIGISYNTNFLDEVEAQYVYEMDYNQRDKIGEIVVENNNIFSKDFKLPSYAFCLYDREGKQGIINFRGDITAQLSSDDDYAAIKTVINNPAELIIGSYRGVMYEGSYKVLANSGKKINLVISPGYISSREAARDYDEILVVKNKLYYKEPVFGPPTETEFCSSIDYSHPDIVKRIAISNKKILVQCSNGLDDDRDGSYDYPADFGCESREDYSEDNEGNFSCSNGLDDDGDELIDQNDPGCENQQYNNESYDYNPKNIPLDIFLYPKDPINYQLHTYRFICGIISGKGPYFYRLDTGNKRTIESYQLTYSRSFEREHTYTGPGNYNVRCEVKDGGGSLKTAEVRVAVD